MATKKGKAPKHSVEISNKTELHFSIDEEKAAQIKRCLENGKLSIVMTRVDMSANGRYEEPYLYD